MRYRPVSIFNPVLLRQWEQGIIVYHNQFIKLVFQAEEQKLLPYVAGVLYVSPHKRFIFERLQWQRDTRFLPPVSYILPSLSAISKSPSALRKPLLFTVIFVGLFFIQGKKQMQCRHFFYFIFSFAGINHFIVISLQPDAKRTLFRYQLRTKRWQFVPVFG